MSFATREFKHKVGALLLKLRNRDFGLTDDEQLTAKFLCDKSLARYNGPDQSPKIMSAGDMQDYLQLWALSYYELTGLGIEFVQRHSEEELIQGKFLLPGEPPWHERWLTKWIVAVVLVILGAVAGFFLKR